MAEARGIAAASLEALTDQFKLDQRKLLPQDLLQMDTNGQNRMVDPGRLTCSCLSIRRVPAYPSFHDKH